MEMGLGQSIAKRWQAIARMLALVAAIALAVGVHPPHAVADDSGAHHHAAGPQGHADHSHFGASCLQAELDKSQPAKKGAVPLGHADCIQIFDPLQRPPLTAIPASAVVSIAAPSDVPFRQLITSFDPPPPRRC